MREFLSGKDEGGNALFLIEWDKSKGTISFVGCSHLTVCTNVKLTHGLVGHDEVHYNGTHFKILQSIHNRFMDEFPTTDLEGEYMKADEWCEKNKSKRSVKNAASFMLNWLKRSRGGNMSRGGVIY